MPRDAERKLEARTDCAHAWALTPIRHRCPTGYDNLASSGPLCRMATAL